MAVPPIVLEGRVAWVGRAYEVNGTTEYEVTREGMLRQEIVDAFQDGKTQLDYNRKALIKAVIYEAYLEAVEGGEDREPLNVRGFWYERLLYTLLTVMRESGDKENMASINVAINEAWGELVEGGWVTYSAMNIRSAKSKNYYSAVCADSPYPTAIVLVEKEDHFPELHDLVDTYGVNFVATGGQNSRAAAMEFATDLARVGVSLDQDFTVYSFCDFDPDGWDIPLGFINHLGLKVRGNIELVRLGLLREQIGDSVIRYQAVPYPLESKTAKGQKVKESKYDRFVEESGGLLVPGPDGEPEPMKVELDIYKPSQLREKIIVELARRLDPTAYQERALCQCIESNYDAAWREVMNGLGHPVNEAYAPYWAAIDETRDHLEHQEAQRAPEERRRLRELAEVEETEQEWLDSQIEQQQAAFDEEKARLEAELLAKIEQLESERDDGIEWMRELSYERLKPVYDEMTQLGDRIADETADIRDQLNALDTLETRLESDAQREFDELMEDADLTEIPDSDGLISEITSNGSWQSWIENHGITPVTAEDLAEAARQHSDFFSWDTDWQDERRVREWMLDTLNDSAPWLEPEGPDKSPEKLIDDALKRQSDADGGDDAR